LSLAAGLCLLLAGAPLAPGAFKGRSVVLVSIDTLRADHLGAYGYPRPTSPTIDALARESLLFERAYSQSSLTAPSHMTMLTGVLPPVHGVLNSTPDGITTRLGDALPTLATLLQRAGYRTHAHVGGGNVAPGFGFDQGFDAYSAAWPGDLRLAARALTEAARGGGRLFFFAHTYDVHDPYLPPPETLSLFTEPGYAGRLIASQEELARAAGSATWRDVVREFWRRFDRTSPADLRQLQALYDAEIRAMDARLSDFLAAFRAAGLDRSAILVLTSDHGEEFLEHGGTRHGPRLYEEILQVPLLVRLPGGAAAARRPELARLLDLTPTLLELLGLPVPDHVQGEPLLSRRAARPRPVYATEPRNGAQSLRLGDMKFVRHGGREELFDLAGDPRETRNLWSADAAYTWRSRLDRILEGCLALGARFTAGPGSRLDPQTRLELEALGYVGGP
jgi:arylsulfatase A-like enzyme